MAEEEKKEEPQEPTEPTEDELLSGLFNEDEEEEETPEKPKVKEKPKEEEEEEEEEEPKEDTVVETAKAVSKVGENYEKRLERRDEINDFLNSEDGKPFVKYAGLIKKVALNPQFINVKIDRIPGLALTPSLLSKIYSGVKEEADKAAKDTKIGGNSVAAKQTGEEPDYSKMEKDEFQQTVAKAKLGVFVKKQ